MKIIIVDNRYYLMFIIFLVISINGCKKDEPPVNTYKYQIPEQTNDGWKVASLSAVEMNEIPITQLMNELLNNIEDQIHSILIIKNSKLVFEEYFPGYAFYHGPLTEFKRETKHNLASVTKSYTSALIGLAIDKGFIEDVDQKVFSFFTEYADLSNEEKDKITLEHLLTMSSGLEWDESTHPYSHPGNDIYQLFHHSDPIRYVLDKPIETVSGTQFLYSSGSTNVLGEIIRKGTGLRADDFAVEYLFSPLGITDYEWKELPNDVLFASGDLKLRPRDMAKLGDLYLHKGIWKSQQIISASWVDVSTRSYINATPNGVNWDYGYQWWLYNYEVDSGVIESFSARGWGGQSIIVFPDLDMVVVTTAGYYDEPHLEFHINAFVIPLILSSAL